MSLQLSKVNHTIWEKITGLRGNCAGFCGMRGICERAENIKLRGLQDEWYIYIYIMTNICIKERAKPQDFVKI